MSIALMSLLLQAAAPEPANPEPLNRHEWVTHEDYPIEASRRGEQGSVRFRLEIDAEGRPTSCSVVESAGPMLDSHTCDLMLARARFAPARDAQGSAVPGTYSTVFTWRLQDSETQGFPFEPTEFVTSMESLADGGIRCTVIANDGRPQQAAAEECSFLSGTRAADFLRAMDAEARYTLFVRIEPEGLSAPRAEGDWGEPVTETRGDFVLRPDGSFESCDETMVVQPVLDGFPAVPRPCDFSSPRGNPFSAAAPDAGPRRGKITVALYLSTAPGAVRQLPRPEQPLPSLFGPADYPRAAIMKAEEGIVRFRLDIGVTGRVTGCTVTESSGSPALDARTCEVLSERARFRPALDDAGNPVESHLSHRAVWRLDDGGETLPFEPRFRVVTLTAGPDGGCEIRSGGEARPAALDDEVDSCRALAMVGVVVMPNAPAGARLVLVEELQPIGAIPAEPPAVEGTQLWSVEVEIEIAADGRIASCQPVEQVTVPELTGSGQLCTALDYENVAYGPAPEGAPPRRARFRSRLYLDARRIA